jgi:type II secretory pathway pseudopilin PulG
MNISLCPKRNQAMTLIETVVVTLFLAFLFAAIVPAYFREKHKAQRIHCSDNLHQISFAFLKWDRAHAGDFPMSVSETNGGTMEYDTGPNAWRHFLALSNRLSAPKLLFCPAEFEGRRTIAPDFTQLKNVNLSYFVGLVSNETDPQLFLAGDRNITNGAPLQNGVLELTANRPAAWTTEIHNRVGNIACADGSVMQLASPSLQRAVATTNRLLMPILSP